MLHYLTKFIKWKLKKQLMNFRKENGVQHRV
jgi:hypothetical protein